MLPLAPVASGALSPGGFGACLAGVEGGEGGLWFTIVGVVADFFGDRLDPFEIVGLRAAVGLVESPSTEGFGRGYHLGDWD